MPSLPLIPLRNCKCRDLDSLEKSGLIIMVSYFLFNEGHPFVLCAKNLGCIFLPKGKNAKISCYKHNSRFVFFCVCMHMCVYEYMYVCIVSVLHCISESTFVGDARVAMVVTYF